jgi:signal transduction histidine kinase
VGTVLVGLGCVMAMAESSDEIMVQPPFEVRSVEVNGRPAFPDAAGFFDLPAQAQDLHITFAPSSQTGEAPVRFKWQLGGLLKGWRDTNARGMRAVLRFSDETTDVLSETTFHVSGQTPGWTTRFQDSAFVARRETVVVPPGVNRVRMMISSAGPPETVGAYVMRNLFFSMPNVATTRTRMIPSAVRSKVEGPEEQSPPEGWNRGGLHVTDAHVIPYGDEGEVGLALVDDNIDGHADWAMLRSKGWPVLPGEALLVEWEEAYSISRGDSMQADIPSLPAGLYQFRMGGFTVMGAPTGVEASIPIQVRTALWARPWVWASVPFVGAAVVLAGWRLREWRRVTGRLKLAERERLIEQERVRIAQDIHDDLGARVTEISLLSSTAQEKAGLSDELRADLARVSELSQDMVRALYETVWSVDPQNDNLDSLVAYLCQMVSRMCSQADLRCRLTAPELPRDIQVPSKLRHDIVMTVKEAVHNVIKHASATQVRVGIGYADRVLAIELQDNGKGFDLSQPRLGSGLTNMQHRMRACGGRYWVQSQPGQGTLIRLESPALDGLLGEAEGVKVNSQWAKP